MRSYLTPILLLLAFASAPAQAGKPNIVMIVVDDMRFDEWYPAG